MRWHKACSLTCTVELLPVLTVKLMRDRGNSYDLLSSSVDLVPLLFEQTSQWLGFAASDMLARWLVCHIWLCTQPDRHKMQTEMSRGLLAGPPPGLDMLLEQEPNPNPNPVPYPLHSTQAALHESGRNSSQLQHVPHPVLPAEQPSSSRLAAAMPQPAPLVVPSTNGAPFGQTTGPCSPTQQDGGSPDDDWLEETQRNSVQDPQFWDRVTAAEKELPSDLPGSSSIQQEGAQKIAVPRDSRHSQQADAHGSAVAAQQSRGSKRQASPDEAVPAPDLKRNAGQLVSEQPLPAIDASPDARQGPDGFVGPRQSVLSHQESTRRRLLSAASDDGDESAQGQCQYGSDHCFARD